MEGIRRIESMTSSEASACELPRHVSHGIAHQSPSLDSLVTESTTSTEWTDEKHSLYLKSMETSFVNQLYDSVKKEKLQRPKSSRQKNCTSSGQFKVLRDGCWKKVDFERSGVQLHKTNDSYSFVASPWIQHFRSGSKSRTVSASCSLQDSASTKEVSDQNFVDEEKGERANNNNVVPRS